MDKEKIKELENWLREAEKNESTDYIAIAINEKHNMVGTADGSVTNMLEMLCSFAIQNPGFKDVLVTAAAYFIQKDIKRKEEAKK